MRPHARRERPSPPQAPPSAASARRARPTRSLPFSNPRAADYYLGTLFELDKDSPQDVELAEGDTLVGDTLRSTLAEVMAQLLEGGACENADFSVTNVEGTPPAVDELRKRLVALK